jgi:hypothetical protein
LKPLRWESLIWLLLQPVPLRLLPGRDLQDQDNQPLVFNGISDTPFIYGQAIELVVTGQGVAIRRTGILGQG